MDKSRTTTSKDGGRMVALRRRAPGAGGQERLRLEADGQTHRRDCECARCEAGFTPSERDRQLASRRAAEKQGRLMAARAVERKREKARLAQTELLAYFRHGNAVADAEVQRLRAVRAKVLADRRVDELLRLRREGWDSGSCAGGDRSPVAARGGRGSGERQRPRRRGGGGKRTDGSAPGVG